MFVTRNLTSLPLMSALNTVNPVAELEVDPKVATYAFVPSWVTLASTISCLPFVASTALIKYLALLNVALAKVSRFVVAELLTLTLASAIEV